MDARITDSTLIALGGLIGVVALLFLLITKFKWHVFIALLVPILPFALLPVSTGPCSSRRSRPGRKDRPEHRRRDRRRDILAKG
jgi:hypothetical protein